MICTHRQLPLKTSLRCHLSSISIEKYRHLLQCWTLGLRKHEINDEAFKDQDDDIDKVEPPLQFFQADRVDISVRSSAISGFANGQTGNSLIQDTSQSLSGKADSHAFGTNGER